MALLIRVLYVVNVEHFKLAGYSHDVSSVFNRLDLGETVSTSDGVVSLVRVVWIMGADVGSHATYAGATVLGSVVLPL